jgi:hypothetical protein
VGYEFTTDQARKRIHPLLPDANIFGCQPCPDRDVLEGIFRVLKTGARWRDLTKQLPSPSTYWRRLHDWEEDGVWDAVWRDFISLLDATGMPDWEQSFMDGSFVPAKKEGSASERPRRAKERSGWWWRTARVFLWEAPFPRHRTRR